MDKWDKRFLALAAHISSWSKDPSTQTGAVIVRPDKSIASVGFNGFPVKMPDEHQNYENRDEKYSRIIHCEMNALNFSTDRSHEGYTLYTWPFLSCDRCFVHMVQAGITHFVAPECPDHLKDRWEPVFEKVRQYASECDGITIKEYPFYDIQGIETPQTEINALKHRIEELNQIIIGNRPDLFHDSLVRGSRVSRMEEVIHALTRISNSDNIKDIKQIASKVLNDNKNRIS